MFAKFNEERNKDNNLMTDTNSKIKNSLNPFNANQSALVKLNIDDINKDLDFDDVEIDKIEKKLNRFKNQELFTRENQVSRAVDEIIEVPKKNMKEEVNILADYKKKNRIKDQLREKEEEQDKKQRKIELENNSKKMEKLKDKIKIYKHQLKKKVLCMFLKYLIIILFISISVATLIILIDKFK